MKKLMSFILALSLMICMVPAASAASDEATEAAEVLYELGLFRGTGTNEDGTPIFDLEKTPTRNQAVIMLIRLLGKEEEALAGNWDLPFTDVANDSTAYPYIGYAYANGLTNGTSATTYSGGNPIKANQYITFVLRAMGYESGVDFEVATAWNLSDKLGITGGKYTATTHGFTRGDIAFITLSALTCTFKDSDETLFSMIQENGGIPKGVSYVEPRELKYNYCNDWGTTVRYEESYIQGLSIAKIGSLYQFRLALKPGSFSRAYLFPAGYHSEDYSDNYSKTIHLFATDETDAAVFFVDEEFVFKNPVCRTQMVLDLVPILTAFPDDFKFAEGRATERIMAMINTKNFPK